MNIIVKKQNIENILLHLQPFLEKKDATQITSHILFIAKNNLVEIKSTDLEIGLKVTTDSIIIKEEGEATANGKKLLEIIRILKDENDISLNVEDEDLIIKQKRSRFRLPIFDPTTYPSFPKNEDKPKISLDSLTLIQNLKKITPTIDTNNPKFELNGALINIQEDKTDLVGTDTRRLAVATIKEESNKPLSLIIPKKAIIEIQKLFLNEIDIYFDENYLVISNNNYFFFTKLINGKFPDYQRILPKTKKHIITLPKKEMLENIKMITTISYEIQIEFTPSGLDFRALSSENIEAKTNLPLDTGINDFFEISFNSKYMIDFINHIKGDTFLIEINEVTLPFTLKDEDFLTVIMPIIL